MQYSGEKMKRIAIFVAVSAAIVLIAGAVLLLREDPTGMATGSPEELASHKALWEMMAPSGKDFLKAYADILPDPPDDPLLLLTAFNELAFSVTGKGGLWRKTVRNDYFGCEANQELPFCRRFSEIERYFLDADKLQARISAVDTAAQARKFIKANGNILKEYIREFVPQDRSLSSIQETPFFNKYLSASLNEKIPYAK
jgi:hypothetical protein